MTSSTSPTPLTGAPGRGFPLAPPLRLTGDAAARGRAQAALPGSDIAAVRDATVGQVETARAEGLIDADALAYLDEQRTFHAAHDPGALAEVRGIAEGFVLSEADLFAFLHLSLLRARRNRPASYQDGCSTWAVSHGPDGPLLVKNRDASGRDFGVQRVMLHAGPDIPAGSMLCVGSLGAPAGYSSGINPWGFALADTYVPAPAPAVGWLRYFLMTRLLAECRSVAEAVAMIGAAPHAGGGTLVLADATGATATVDFAGARPTFSTGETVWRTNHYPRQSYAGSSPAEAADTIASTSRARFAFLSHTLPSRVWNVAAASRLMATHEAAGVPGPLLCAHREAGTSQTLSCAIYACRDGELHFSDGNPCLGRWATYRLDNGASPTTPNAT